MNKFSSYLEYNYWLKTFDPAKLHQLTKSIQGIQDNKLEDMKTNYSPRNFIKTCFIRLLNNFGTLVNFDQVDDS